MGKAEAIIDRQCAAYTEYISDFAKGRRAGRAGIFGLLTEDMDRFYEQRDMTGLMEQGVRRFLLNGVFHELMTDEFIRWKDAVVEWTPMHIGVDRGFPVESVERQYQIEFSISLNGKKTGYRYTEWYAGAEPIRQYMKDSALDEVDIICFTDTLPGAVYSALKDKPVKKITLRDFFLRFFEDSLYRSYVQKVQKAVNDAARFAGFQTINNLNRQYLPYFIDEKEAVLADRQQFHKNYHVFHPADQNNPKDPRHALSNKYKQILPKDVTQMDHNFFDEGHIFSLSGICDFAHSFISSEYLFDTVRSDNYLDYTAVVCGYLKAVEQLMFHLFKYSCSHRRPGDRFYIKAANLPQKQDFADEPSYNTWKKSNLRSSGKYTLIRIADAPGDDNRPYYDTTFGSLANFLAHNKKLWNVSSGAVDRISAYLFIYCDECRNEHFHKDNIDIKDTEEVSGIRSNTLIFFYYLLGGFHMSGNAVADKNDLGIADRTFEKMYRAVEQFGGGNYFILDFDNEKQVLAALPMTQEDPEYDENALMKNKRLRFVRVHNGIANWRKDDWGKIEDDPDPSDVLTVSPKKMPTAITYVEKVSGIKKAVFW